MSLFQRSTEKRRLFQELRMREEELAVVLAKNRPGSPKEQLEQDKKNRREIANSNERRRMQSINAGFTALRSLIPHTDGEKLSKAAILSHTTDYLAQLEEEKVRLQNQNNKLQCMLEEVNRERNFQDSPPPKRKKRDTESSDEGISLSVASEYGDDSLIDDLRREISDLRNKLEQEHHHRITLEDQKRYLEARLYPDHLRQITSQVQRRMKLQEEKELALIEEKQRLEEEEKHMSPISISHSMSRRNLDTIFEAIRHLEGDREEEARDGKHIPHIEESERDSVSEHEDMKSESSGRDSPVNLSQQSTHHYHHRLAATLSSYPPHHLTQNHTFVEKYPVAVHLLHRPVPPFYHRPGVIVHKS